MQNYIDKIVLQAVQNNSTRMLTYFHLSKFSSILDVFKRKSKSEYYCTLTRTPASSSSSTLIVVLFFAKRFALMAAIFSADMVSLKELQNTYQSKTFWYVHFKQLFRLYISIPNLFCCHGSLFVAFKSSFQSFLYHKVSIVFSSCYNCQKCKKKLFQAKALKQNINLTLTHYHYCLFGLFCGAVCGLFPSILCMSPSQYYLVTPHLLLLKDHNM